MSLFKAFIVPFIEQHLAKVAPEVAELALKQLYSIATDIIDHVVSKTKDDSSLRIRDKEHKNG